MVCVRVGVFVRLLLRLSKKQKKQIRKQPETSQRMRHFRLPFGPAFDEEQQQRKQQQQQQLHGDGGEEHNIAMTAHCGDSSQNKDKEEENEEGGGEEHTNDGHEDPQPLVGAQAIGLSTPSQMVLDLVQEQAPASVSVSTASGYQELSIDPTEVSEMEEMLNGCSVLIGMHPDQVRCALAVCGDMSMCHLALPMHYLLS